MGGGGQLGAEGELGESDAHSVARINALVCWGSLESIKCRTKVKFVLCLRGRLNCHRMTLACGLILGLHWYF